MRHYSNQTYELQKWLTYSNLKYLLGAIFNATMHQNVLWVHFLRMFSENILLVYPLGMFCGNFLKQCSVGTFCRNVLWKYFLEYLVKMFSGILSFLEGIDSLKINIAKLHIFQICIQVLEMISQHYIGYRGTHLALRRTVTKPQYLHGFIAMFAVTNVS